MHELTIMILKALSSGGHAFLFLFVFTRSPPAIPRVGVSASCCQIEHLQGPGNKSGLFFLYKNSWNFIEGFCYE